MKTNESSTKLTDMQPLYSLLSSWGRYDTAGWTDRGWWVGTRSVAIEWEREISLSFSSITEVEGVEIIMVSSLWKRPLIIYRVQTRVCIRTMYLIQKLWASYYLMRECACQNVRPSSQAVCRLVQSHRHYQGVIRQNLYHERERAYETTCFQ